MAAFPTHVYANPEQNLTPLGKLFEQVRLAAYPRLAGQLPRRSKSCENRVTTCSTDSRHHNPLISNALQTWLTPVPCRSILPSINGPGTCFSPTAQQFPWTVHITLAPDKSKGTSRSKVAWPGSKAARIVESELVSLIVWR